MKKILLYLLIIMLSFLAPLNRTDIASLQPIEVVGVYKGNNRIEIITDTGDFGTGITIQDAYNDLINNSLGVIYLDTAEYLLLSKEAIDHIDELRNVLKGDVKVCMWNGGGDLRDAAKYLPVHKKLPSLRKWNKEVRLPEYVVEKICGNP